MYHCHRYAKDGWAGEPEMDPTQCYEEREQVEGWELKPETCLQASYEAVLRERAVTAGLSRYISLSEGVVLTIGYRIQHCNGHKRKCIFWSFALMEVSNLAYSYFVFAIYS
jgi:hypothetical protein